MQRVQPAQTHKHAPRPEEREGGEQIDAEDESGERKIGGGGARDQIRTRKKGRTKM